MTFMDDRMSPSAFCTGIGEFCLLTDIASSDNIFSHCWIGFQIIIQGGSHMKVATSVLVIAVVLLTFVGAALAAEMSGVVTGVDVEKSTLMMKSEKMDVSVDCEVGSLLKDVKVGDQVTVEYKESGGKKIATKVIPMKKKKAPVGC